MLLARSSALAVCRSSHEPPAGWRMRSLCPASLAKRTHDRGRHRPEGRSQAPTRDQAEVGPPGARGSLNRASAWGAGGIGLVGVIGYPRHAELTRVLDRLHSYAETRGWTLLAEAGLTSPGDGTSILHPEMLPRLDLLLTLGGDGTLLRGARLLSGADVPVLGISLGRMGFLISVSPDELEFALAAVAAGEIDFDERMMLNARIESDDGVVAGSHVALNEVVLHRGGAARLVRLAVRAHGEAVGTYSGDGIVLSTPTGSTAYSLVAGGPIVFPLVECIVATPICAHTLSARSLVLSATETVAVEVLPPSPELMLTVDHRDTAKLSPGDRVIVSRTDRPLRLVRVPRTDFLLDPPPQAALG